jgi:hypothetical protein
MVLIDGPVGLNLLEALFFINITLQDQITIHHSNDTVDHGSLSRSGQR